MSTMLSARRWSQVRSSSDGRVWPSGLVVVHSVWLRALTALRTMAHWSGGPAGVEVAEPVDVGLAESGEASGVQGSGPVGAGVASDVVEVTAEVAAEPVDGEVRGGVDEFGEVLGDDGTVSSSDGDVVLEGDGTDVEGLGGCGKGGSGFGVTFGPAGLGPGLPASTSGPVGDIAAPGLWGHILQPLHGPGA